MHPADQQEFDKLNTERADLRRLLNETKEKLRVANAKLEKLYARIKNLANEIT